ncbi:beta-propeller domain-containing protein [Sedimentibacter saalensis]|uniref:Putative secreted protein with C-terminal beta-propeller domain n=1 Tax=Sedimentibacter saalensis TaxID=130788 RepID=A0A562J4D7_9FIRM|nr:beta-propeller domain-containing protein [Sedimentibacter saalensis]TWH77943.1 putative secreted protein with C-terminal beta-propeller domain [Sedimentibacter saalensis]
MNTIKLMKKIFILSVVFIFCFTIAAFAEDSVTVYVDNEKVDFDVNPFIEGGRTLVPLRGVFEKLGARVDWNKSIQEVVIKDDNNEIQMLLNKNKVMVNGEIKDIDVSTMMINSRTFAPLRFISENLGHDVRWDGSTNSVYITKNTSVPENKNILKTVGSKENLIALLEYNSKLYGYLWTDRFVAAEDSNVTDKEEAVQQVPQEAGASQDHSDTNVQVEGVQEGDIIKNDGKYIYIKTGEKLKIIDSNPLNPKIVSTVNVPENTSISEIYISGNKLVVIGQNNFYYIMKEYEKSAVPAEDKTVDYIMPPRYYDDRTNVLVYDISNVEKPVLQRELLLDGNYLSGREINGYLYMVTTRYLNIYYDRQDVSLPYYTNVLKNEKHEFTYDDIKYFPNYIDSRYMYTAGINLNDSSVEPDVDVYLGGSDTIYVSEGSLYAAVADYSYDYNIKQTELYSPGYSTSTVVYKYELEKGNIKVATQGEVPGTIINQFSMDEHEGMLRIATTTGEVWNETSKNNMYILDENLKLKGKLEGLAPGERIYSTRFAGDRVYMVTFRQVDPLYVIDASDPSNPRAAGMLKIPGYSTYLHIVDEKHILGFGYDTKVSEWGGIVNGGFKMSLFDVSDIKNPKETFTEVIGEQGTYSELLYNHKALMFSLNKGIMAFPINSTAENYKTDFNGAYVYNVSLDNISYKTKISHMDSDNYLYGYEVKRIIYIGDFIYTFSENEMQIHSITTNKKINELNIY